MSFQDDFESYGLNSIPPDPPYKILSGQVTVVKEVLPTNSLKIADGMVMISETGAETWTQHLILAKTAREQYNLSGVLIGIKGIGTYDMGLNLAGAELRIYKDGLLDKNILKKQVLAPTTVKGFAYYLKMSIQTQPDGSVELKGKIWREDQAEPEWLISYVDVENTYTAGSPTMTAVGGRTIYFDDLSISYQIGELQRVPTLVTDGVMSETIKLHNPNHIWGQLQDFQGLPLGGKEVWLNRNGETVLASEIVTPKGYQGNPDAYFPYPAITKEGGGFDLSWIMNLEGTLQVAAEFKGDQRYEPDIGPFHQVTVQAEPIPPDAPIVQIPSSTDSRANNNPLGTNVHAKQIVDYGLLEQELDRMVEAGVSWIRFGIAWQDIEPQKGVFKWQWHDALVNACAERKISILGGLWYGNSNYSSYNWWSGPPDNFQDFADYCRRVVARYKDKIKYWEVWNEPNAGGFWWQEPNPVDYAKLLKLAYAAIKEADPTAVVVAPSLWGCDVNYLYALYQQGCKEYMDVVSVHPYCGQFLPNHVWGWATEPENLPIPPADVGYSWFDFPYLRAIRKCMEVFGDNEKPMWITEFGYGTHKEVNPKSYYEGTIEEMQRDGIKMAWDYSQWIEVGFGKIEKFFEYKWIDYPTETSGAHGLIRYDGTLKPAYDMYKFLAQTYNNEKVTEQPPTEGDGVRFLLPIFVIVLLLLFSLLMSGKKVTKGA